MDTAANADYVSITPLPLVFAFVCLTSSLLFSLQPDLVSFRAIVHQSFPEPRVLEGLLGCNPLLRIVDKNLLQQVEE
jgi:hypothetical protein